MSDRLRLVLLSFLMLFVELALIRWTGSNVVYLSYFSNFVLLGSFLGIGVGFLRARARRELFGWSPIALAFFVAFVLLFPAEINRSGDQLIYFGAEASGLPTWVMLPGIFLAVAWTMALIAEGVARTFVKFDPLEAYRLDILGAIGGVVAFSALSFVRAPPIAWGFASALLFVLLLGRRAKAIHLVALGSMVVMLGQQSAEPGQSWSPYYRVTLLPGERPLDPIHVTVNGIPHQAVEQVDSLTRTNPVYALPYTRAASRRFDDVLVIGAGTGNDVAVALARGARRVDAVEIDPRLYEIGRDLHPDRPYSDPRVSTHITDGRVFLERTDRTYDLILFALPDSLTLVSGQSSLRLESYLFTVEAVEAARDRLKPGGVFAMYNFYREQWLVDRLARTLGEAFGSEPCVDTIGVAGRLALLTVGSDPDSVRCPSAPHPSASAPHPATDDHPFVYLRERGIPSFYLIALALILVVSLTFVRGAAGRIAPMTGYADLFFMGAAFLLLETKSVVQFALLFGTTWLVNALVFTGILVAVLGAVEVARRWPRLRPGPLYAALFAALALAWAIPLGRLLALGFVPRFIAATALAFTPIFLANLIFAERFRRVGSSGTAFGANLLGAMVGGVVEYASLATGYRFLLVIVAMIYALAFLAGRRRVGDPAPAAVTG